MKFEFRIPLFYGRAAGLVCTIPDYPTVVLPASPSLHSCFKMKKNPSGLSSLSQLLLRPCALSHDRWNHRNIR
jgi:hypothetical protein